MILLLVVISGGLWVSDAYALTAPPQLTEYKLLEPLPYDGKNTPSQTTNAATFIPGLFRLVLAIASVLAVVRLIFAGIIYMTSDAYNKKNEAKNIINDALWGLGLAMGAWVIVATILGPQALTFNLSLQTTAIKQNTNAPGTTPVSPGGASCTGCSLVSVPHKAPPAGCAAPGPCVIQSALNAKLVELHKLQPLLVTESYPPTRSHRAACHGDGSCVDATISSASDTNIKKFIENASSVGLKAQFETTTAQRAEDIRRATGLSSSQVFYVEGITGEHFSIYYQ